jgi:hypothetical protein
VMHALFRAAHVLILILLLPRRPPVTSPRAQTMRRGAIRRLQRTVRGRRATHGDAPGHLKTKQAAPSPVMHALFRAAHVLVEP